MDSFSGSYPPEFISFYLDMSSEEQSEAVLATTTEPRIEEEVSQSHEKATASQAISGHGDVESEHIELPGDNPATTVPTPSPSTDESISAYIERQLQTLGCQGSGLGISFLPPTTSAIVNKSLPTVAEKVSESDPILQVTGETSNKGSAEEYADLMTDVHSEAGISATKVDYFQTDTSDAEELQDSSGAETLKESPFLIALENLSATGSEVPKEAGLTSSAGLPDATSPKLLSPTRALSASARTLINQHFTETNPSILPVGHATVAFNQGQVHSILRAVSTETLTSCFHQMKNILEEAFRVGRSQSTHQGPAKQRIKCFRKKSDSPGLEGQDSDIGTEGYTSGALSSEDEFVINSQRTGKELSIVPPPSPPGQDSPCTTDPTISHQVPSPGFCSTDYEPLATLTADQASASSPPRKRRRVPGRSGKIMKEAYSKGIQWTRTFVTGPLDPEHNKHKFYCQICKANVSIFSKGAREITRHFQCESHFRKDQRWRYENLKKKDSVTGRIIHEVRGKKGQILTPLELEREKPFFMQAPLVEMGCSYPFYEDHMAGLGSIAGQEEIRLCVQISLVALFAPRCGDLHVLESLWSQIGTVTNHQSLFSPYNWGSTTLTVSINYFQPRGLSRLLWTGYIFIHANLFQTIFHHIFLCGISDIAYQVKATGQYSLEFETQGTYSFVSIRFWKGESLNVVRLLRYRTASEPAAGFLLALSRLLSAISAQPQIVSVSGCPAELIPLLERSCFFQKGIEYPFRFDALSLLSMMHERWGSVFGSISFFSQLKFLITFLDGCGGQPWAALMPEFVRVRSMSHRL